MSKVCFEEFAKEFANDLEITDDQFLTSNLRDVPQYDSMGKITVSLTIEKLFGFQIAYDVLDKADTIQSLYEYACNKASGD
jgi:acyl carrier protein